MELALVIWFIGALSAIGTMFGWFVALSGIALVVSLFIFAILHDSDYDSPDTPAMRSTFKSIAKIFVALFVTFSLLYSLTPTTKTGWLMAGGYLTQTTLQSDMAKKFSSIVEIKLEEVLDEATKQAKIKAGSINEKKE